MKNTTLRDACALVHQQAEETNLSQMLVTGQMDQKSWATFVYNLRPIYSTIESRNFFELPELNRTSALISDYTANCTDNNIPIIVPSVNLYTSYLSCLDSNSIWSAVYVHYMGDLYGGQMIASKIPWQASYLKFTNRANCIDYVRQNTINTSPILAIESFKWIIQIYNEIYQLIRPSTSG